MEVIMKIWHKWGPSGAHVRMSHIGIDHNLIKIQS